jgi:hypothetical protein
MEQKQNDWSDHGTHCPIHLVADIPAEPIRVGRIIDNLFFSEYLITVA